MSNGNGFKQQPKAGRKERLRGLDTEMQNLQMASRISQMMTQQLLQGMKNIQEDLGKAMGIISELQYKILAIQSVSGLDLNKLNDVANEKRLNDFIEASDKEDVNGKFTVGSLVDASSTVILTSTTKEADRGIFRSRIKLAECGVPDLIKAFMGQPVGTKATINLNEIEHEVELLAIRQPPVVASAVGDDRGEDAETARSALLPQSNAGEAPHLEVVGNA